MAPKEQKPSKKAQKAKQERVIEDLTFGLKNKNKSKKVQQFIQRAELNVKNNMGAIEAVSKAQRTAYTSTQSSLTLLIFLCLSLQRRRRRMLKRRPN